MLIRLSFRQRLAFFVLSSPVLLLLARLAALAAVDARWSPAPRSAAAAERGSASLCRVGGCGSGGGGGSFGRASDAIASGQASSGSGSSARGGGGAPQRTAPVSTPGAVTYWPATHPAGGPRPPPAAVHVWALDACTGGSPAALLPAADAARLPQPAAAGPCARHACAGALVIRRRVGCPLPPGCAAAACGGTAGPPLERGGGDAATLADAWSLGPDELFVLLEGAELLRLQGVHTGGCTYVFPFDARLPGVYRIIAIALRAGWAALDETLQGFPPLTLDDIAGDRALVSLGDVAGAVAAHTVLLHAASLPCEHRCAASISHGSWVRAQVPADDRAAPLAAPAPAYVPQGRTYGANVSARGLGIRYYAPVTSGLVWLPRAGDGESRCCAAPPPSQVAAGRFTQCLGRAAALRMRGDSHVRVLFNGLIARACGRAGDAVAKGIMGDACAGGADGGGSCAATLRACFTWEPLGFAPAWADNATATDDLLVVNFAHHAAAGAVRWVVADYAAQLRAYLAALPPRRAGARAVWVEATPVVTRNDADIHRVGDWRTDHRLALLARIAERELAPRVAAGDIRIARIHAALAPLADAPPDSAHFHGLPSAMDVVYDAVLEALCDD